MTARSKVRPRQRSRPANGAGPARSRRHRGSPGAASAGRNGARGVMLTVEKAVAQIRAGRMIIVVDDAHRENEGDIVFAAEKATPENVNFAVKYGRGILCAPMEPVEADRLGLKLMLVFR